MKPRAMAIPGGEKIAEKCYPAAMSRSGSSIEKIPVAVVSPRASSRLHWQRRSVQLATLAIALLIPITGLFRIDPVAGAFIVIDRQIWWADFFLVFGFWVMIAATLVVMYSTIGTAFCGWSCPQNTVSEWANMLTRRLLGRRAEVELNGAKMQVAAAKNRWTHWLVLGLILFATSAAFALIPMFYFYQPDIMWSFVTFADDARLAPSLHYIYFIFVLVIFLDVAFIRHFWCRFMCVYKVWQHGFKTKQTLHIAYDAGRAADCEKCNYCVTACFIDLDPRKTDIYDSCINCGECITACNKMHAKKGEPGLLRFEVGERASEAGIARKFRTAIGSLSTRMSWTVPFAAAGLGMFVWGLISYQPNHLAVYRADSDHGAQISDYRVAISNKQYRPERVEISVEGPIRDQIKLSNATANFDSAGRIDLNLHVQGDLAPGLYTFLVRARSGRGWEDTYRVQHFVAKG